jgi:predicted dehydrogenase
MSPLLSRRDFHRGAATAALAASLPSLGAKRDAPPPVRLAVIGPGKRGMNLMRGSFLGDGFEVRAVCDVDQNRLAAAKALADKRQPNTECFATTDHEVAMDRDDVDAVVIATPDHWHAHQILDAARRRKHIYCEKPLTLTLREAQLVIPAVREAGVVFQTGSQQRTEYGHKFVQACELIRNGRFGEVMTVHVGVGDPPAACALDAEEMEPGLDWDRWLGPAPARAYHSDLSPRGVHKHYPSWRRYWEFAGGGLADMGAHHFDITMWALGRDGDGPVEVHPPHRSDGTRGASVVFDDGVRVVHGGRSGATFVGTEGVLAVDRHRISADPAKLLEDPLEEDAARLPRRVGHAQDWLQAIRGGDPTTCPVEVGASSVAICHLLNVAYRLRRSLRWDPAAWRFVDDAEANALCDYQRRAGYQLPMS